MELRLIGSVSEDVLFPEAGIPLWKRVLDTVVILAALPVIIPVVLLVVLYLKVVSRGPVLFRQERVGYYGQPFTLFKFRTMRTDAPIGCHQEYLKELMTSPKPMTKMDLKGDKRVIFGGGVLRATGLDELPQLINVLRGEMSLVGPRPCTIYEYREYSPWHSRRLEALPGLTGLWQVSGKNKLSFERMIQLDIEYAERSSVWLDLSIMLRTFPTLTSQFAEAVAKRLSKNRKSEVAVSPGEGASPLRAQPVALTARWFRSRKDKKCQTRLMLESSDVDIGVRT